MLCLFQCIDVIGCRNTVLNKCAFHPPQCSYEFRPFNLNPSQYQNTLNCNEQDYQIRYEESKYSDQQQNSNLKIDTSNISQKQMYSSIDNEQSSFMNQFSEQNTENNQDQDQKLLQNNNSILSNKYKQKSEIIIDNENQVKSDNLLDTQENIDSQKDFQSHHKQISSQHSIFQEQFTGFQVLVKDENTKQLEEFYPEYMNIDVIGYKIDSQSGNQIAAIHIISNPHTNPNENNVIIYSHGNSTDLGVMLQQYVEIAENLKINVFAYDYSGYGISEGKPNDINSLMDIKSVYEYVTNILQYEWHQIILYGQSIGSGPTIFLGSRREYPVGGIVIHSGFSSGLRVQIHDMEKTHSKDLFPNIDLVPYINCPFFIIHGTKDKIVPVKQAEDLYEKTHQKYKPFFVQNAGHNNIEYSMRYKGTYIQKLKQFVNNVMQEQAQFTKKKLLKQNTAKYWCSQFEHFYAQLHPVVKKSLPTTVSNSFYSSPQAFFKSQNLNHRIHGHSQTDTIQNLDKNQSMLVKNSQQSQISQIQQQNKSFHINNNLNSRKLSFKSSTPKFDKHKRLIQGYEQNSLLKHDQQQQQNFHKKKNIKKFSQTLNLGNETTKLSSDSNDFQRNKENNQNQYQQNNNDSYTNNIFAQNESHLNQHLQKDSLTERITGDFCIKSSQIRKEIKQMTLSFEVDDSQIIQNDNNKNINENNKNNIIDH